MSVQTRRGIIFASFFPTGFLTRKFVSPPEKPSNAFPVAYDRDRYNRIVADFGLINAPETAVYVVGSWKGCSDSKDAIACVLREDGRWMGASTHFPRFAEIPEYKVAEQFLPKGSDWFLSEPSIQAFSPYHTTWFRKDGGDIHMTLLTGAGAYCELADADHYWMYKTF